jgi:hypothetical protein
MQQQARVVTERDPNPQVLKVAMIRSFPYVLHRKLLARQMCAERARMCSKLFHFTHTESVLK